MNTPKLLSFVVPVKDEEETIHELHARIAAEVQVLSHDFELIFVDDGSTDSSWQKIEELSSQDPRVSGIKFRRNIGKANALTAGFEVARGEIVFTMDADLQDDPKEIGRFLEKLDEGFDIISGWKKTRHDPWHKVLPSRVFNLMISKLVGVHLHDHNCGFKCYRAQVVKDVTLYGEMHRMVPSLASLRGYRASEIPVQHHPRLHGQSKYGVKRFLRGFMDLQTVYFLKHFRERPLHLFGGVAAMSLILGLLVFALERLGLIARIDLVFAAVLAGAALPLAGLGFMAELMISRRTARDRDLPISAMTTTHDAVPASNVVPITKADAQAPLILIVDDEPVTRTIHQAQLKRAGFRVEQACTGVEALTKVSHLTSVVVMDIMMPNGDGIEALKAMRARYPEVKIIMVSGHSEIDRAVTAMKLGAFDYLVKPVKADQLVATISRAVQFHALTELHLATA